MEPWQLHDKWVDGIFSRFAGVLPPNGRHWGIAIGPGWYKIVEDMLEQLTAVGCEVGNIKEKFGHLVVHTLDQRQDVSAIIGEAVARAARTCDRCGAPGIMHSDAGWRRPLCCACAASRGAEVEDE